MCATNLLLTTHNSKAATVKGYMCSKYIFFTYYTLTTNLLPATIHFLYYSYFQVFNALKSVVSRKTFFEKFSKSETQRKNKNKKY